MRHASDEELLKAAIWSQLNKVYTAMFCIVIGVHNDFEEQLVDVQPSLNKYKLDGTGVERPPILGVPVAMFGNSKSAVTFPVEVGDTVLCIFSMRAIEVWQESDGNPTTPNNRAKFHEKDAMAITGFFPRRLAVNNPSNRSLPHDTKDLVVAHNIGSENESEVRFKASGDIIINSPTKVEVNCQNAVVNSESLSVNCPDTIWTGDVYLVGSLTATVDVEAGGISVKGHKHDVKNVQSGSATIKSEVPE